MLLILAKYAKLEHDIKTQAWTQELVSSETMLSKIMLLLTEISYSKPFLESDAIYERSNFGMKVNDARLRWKKMLEHLFSLR